jgi:hypothetical protein
VKRVVSLLIALIAALWIGATPVSADIGDSCASATQHIGSKMLAYRYAPTVSATYFDEVYGTAVIKTLTACSTYQSGKITGTFVLPANIEYLEGSTIYQLGYGRSASDHSQYFWLANGTATSVAIGSGLGNWSNNNNGYKPEAGDTYRFHIYKRSSGYVSYDIYNESDGHYEWTYYPTIYWGVGLNFAWWGYEIHDDHSKMGAAGVNLRKMGYSKESSNPEIDPLIYWRDNLYCADAPGGNEYVIQKEGLSWWAPGGFTDSCAHPPYKTMHAAVTSTDFNRDTFNVVDLRP